MAPAGQELAGRLKYKLVIVNHNDKVAAGAIGALFKRQRAAASEFISHDALSVRTGGQLIRSGMTSIRITTMTSARITAEVRCCCFGEDKVPRSPTTLLKCMGSESSSKSA